MCLYSQYFDHSAFILIAKESSGLPMRFVIPKLQTSCILSVRWYCVLPQSHCCILHALFICSPCYRSRTHIVCPTPCRSQVLTGLSWPCSRCHPHCPSHFLMNSVYRLPMQAVFSRSYSPVTLMESIVWHKIADYLFHLLKGGRPLMPSFSQ